jgi:hypothetical protein
MCSSDVPLASKRRYCTAQRRSYRGQRRLRLGCGSLTFRGKKHDFQLSGLSIIDVGAAHLTGSGVVYNLRDLSDFNGTYTAATAESLLPAAGLRLCCATGTESSSD